MPTKSPFPDVEIPNVDLWGLLFETQRDFPDDQVIFRAAGSDRKYTWADVKETASAFGKGLRNLWDWQKGDVLAIYAPNDIDYAPVVYGVFYAAGVVTPASPAYLPDELAFQLTNSESKAIVTTKALLENARKAAKKAGIPENRILLLGAERDESHRFKHWTNIKATSGAVRYRRRRLDPDNDISFLAYSSGTTGLPKGVILSHRNIVANLLQMRVSIGTWYSSGKDKVLGVLPFFHIYGLTSLVLQPLHRGLEVVVMPGFIPNAFLETIQNHKITLVYVAPPILVRLASDPKVDEYDLSSLRMITSAAAPLTKELVDAVHKRIKIRINQAYGLSETSPMTHGQPWDEWYSSVGAVGKLVPNMTAKYVSLDGKELKAGEAGELWVSGPNVFKGYLKNEAATREAISEDGFFKTGDVGFQDENHNFYITDRVKELIKYKGFQVPPAELEGKLMGHPDVQDVAVIGVFDNQRQTEVPRAYVVATNGKKTEQDAQEIVNWLNQKVANHKHLRGGVRFIDEIPKSAAGKILRRILKERVKQEEARNTAKL
ncbi:hypothetical protein DV738_g1761, partial [Chaetothyriales sp. CBS 135597]